MIYILDNDPKLAASYLDDKSLDSMIKDISQVLCNVHHAELYKKNQETKIDRTVFQIVEDYNRLETNLPLKYKQNKGQWGKWTQWARECKANYLYLCDLCWELEKEHRYRFNKYKNLGFLNYARDNVPDLPVKCRSYNYGMTDIPLVMPEKYFALKFEEVYIKDHREPYKTQLIIQSYRNYYQAKLEQKYMRADCGCAHACDCPWENPIKFTNRSKPTWLEI